MIEDNGGVIIEVLAGVEIFWKLDNMMVACREPAGAGRRLSVVSVAVRSSPGQHAPPPEAGAMSAETQGSGDHLSLWQ